MPQRAVTETAQIESDRGDPFTRPVTSEIDPQSSWTDVMLIRHAKKERRGAPGRLWNLRRYPEESMGTDGDRALDNLPAVPVPTQSLGTRRARRPERDRLS